LAAWQLPALYQNVLQYFENHDFIGPEKPLLMLLHICQRLSAILTIGETFELGEFEQDCRQLRLPTSHLQMIAAQLAEKKQAMQQLASILGH
jgi:hypothetical protein